MASETTERPQIGTAVVAVRQPRWRMLGLGFGPSVEVAVRIIVDADARTRCERVDGRPLEELARSAREQLAFAESRMQREYRERRITTSQFQRVEPGAGAQLRGTRAGLQAMHERERGRGTVSERDLAPVDGAPRRTDEPRPPTSSVFRCDRQGITDRISRLRGGEPPIIATAPVAIPAPAERLREAQRQAITEMAALRERRWQETLKRASDDELAPTDQPAETQPAMPDKVTSSVFRCDRQEITDRISRLRSRPSAKDATVDDGKGAAPGT